MPEHVIWLSLAIFVVALLYSSVGHAGASGYIAVMSLFSLAPEVIRPTALVLNLLVASIGTYQFWRAGFLDRVLCGRSPLPPHHSPCSAGMRNYPRTILKF